MEMIEQKANKKFPIGEVAQLRLHSLKRVWHQVRLGSTKKDAYEDAHRSVSGSLEEARTAQTTVSHKMPTVTARAVALEELKKVVAS